jgi:hypothetical protein
MACECLGANFYPLQSPILDHFGRTGKIKIRICFKNVDSGDRMLIFIESLGLDD